MPAFPSGDEDRYVGSPEQIRDTPKRKTGLDGRNQGVSGAEPTIGPERLRHRPLRSSVQGHE